MVKFAILYTETFFTYSHSKYFFMKHAQRVGVFVDVQNMYYSARALYEQKVDFGEILSEAVGERDLVRAFAYVIRADNDDESTFFDALQERGYEIRAKQLLNFYGGNAKGDWDVGLAMDVVRMVDKIDVVVLVSGDGDFTDLLQYARGRGCRTEVMAWGSSASSQLVEVADAVCDLSQDTKRFLIPKTTKPLRMIGRRAPKNTSREPRAATPKRAPQSEGKK